MTKEKTGVDFKSTTEPENKKLFIETYGCQMNVADSELVASIMKMAGYDVCETLEEADAVMLEEIEKTGVDQLEEILAVMLDYAYEAGIMKENGVVYRDLFDTKIMSILLPRPGEVIRRFRELYKENPKAATDFYYKMSCDSDYIRRYRIAKDRKWLAPTEYGELDITINLSTWRR